MANLRLESVAWLRDEVQRWLGLGGEMHKDIDGLLLSQDAQLRHAISVLLEGHCRNANEEESMTEDLSFVLWRRVNVRLNASIVGPCESGLKQIDLLAVERLASENRLERFNINIHKALRLDRHLSLQIKTFRLSSASGVICETHLSIQNLPATLHQIRLLKQPRLTQQETRVFCRETHLEKVNARPTQMRHNVFLGHVQRRQHIVGLELNLITIQVSKHR